MFPLHERTQRRLCRTAFFPLCVLPTLLVALWCVWINLPGRTTELENKWAQATGLRVSIDDLSHPQPGLVRLKTIQFSNPTTEQQVASISSGTLVRDGDRHLVSIEGVEIRESGSSSVWQVLREAVLPQPIRDVEHLRVVVNDVTIVGKERSSSFAQILCQVRPHADGRELTVQLKQNLKSNDSIRLQCIRQDDKSGSQERWRLLTGNRAIPLHLLSGWMPATEHLGANCKFSGTIRCTVSATSNEGEVSGTLSGIDLSRLTAVAQLGAMDGRARLEIASAKFRDSAIEELNGKLTAGPGKIDSALLRKLDLLLSRQQQSSFAALGPAVNYQQLATDIECDQQGWLLTGCCNDTKPGTLMVDRREVLLRHASEQASRRLRHSDVLAMFADEESPWIPVNAQIGWLMQRLPPLSEGPTDKSVKKKVTR